MAFSPSAACKNLIFLSKDGEKETNCLQQLFKHVDFITTQIRNFPYKLRGNLHLKAKLENRIAQEPKRASSASKECYLNFT